VGAQARGLEAAGHRARALGVSKGAVSQWMKRAQQEGIEALKHRPPPGAKARLSEDERAQLPELLAQGAPAHGFRAEVWTCARVAEVIRKEFGVSYHPAHLSRLFRAFFGTLLAQTAASGQTARGGGHKALETGALARA
jgi:transposase